MIVVNLFGAPGAGKSTGAAYIFSKLKMLGVNAELVTEYAKDRMWEGSSEVFKNQAYIFGKQYYRISRLEGKVDVVVTDAPILNSVLYNGSALLGQDFDNVVRKVFDSYNNKNYYVNRSKDYNPAGRSQTKEESDHLAKVFRRRLSVMIPMVNIKGTKADYDRVVSDVLNCLRDKKSFAQEEDCL